MLCAALSGCASREPVVLNDHSRLEAYVGETVTLRGVVPNTKTLCINGVHVRTPAITGDIRGHLAEATGVLQTYEIEPLEDPLAHATLPPGKYYRIIDPETGMLAEARVVE